MKFIDDHVKQLILMDGKTFHVTFDLRIFFSHLSVNGRATICFVDIHSAMALLLHLLYFFACVHNFSPSSFD